MRGAIAGAIVVLGAAVAAWWLWPVGATRQDAASTKRALIKEVKPAVAPTQAVEKVVEIRKLPGRKLMKYVNGQPVWKRPRIDYGIMTTNKPSPESLPIELRVFKEPANRKIAGLLLIEPGTEIVGDMGNMYKDFNRKFLQSLQTPILIDKDDPEDVQNLKRIVREAKIDMKARYDAGEDLESLMKESWHQLKELGLYRTELENELKRIGKGDKSLTKEEMEDYLKAANVMLDSRGSKPLAMPEIIKYRLELREAKSKKSTPAK